MNFLVVDDEPLILQDLEDTLKRIRPSCTVHSFTSARQALSEAEREIYDAAFLDIELGYTNGILLAKQLKELQPNLPVVFVTSYEKYAVDAFSIHARRLSPETGGRRTAGKRTDLFKIKEHSQKMCHHHLRRLRYLGRRQASLV